MSGARWTTLKKAASYADLEQVPRHLVAEILNGELHVAPRPAIQHAIAASAVGMDLGPPYQFGRGGPGGWWLLDEPELHLGQDVVVPDLACWRRERLPAPPAGPAISVPPDWVCEIVSPSTEKLDRSTKRAIYACELVPFLWFVNPLAETLEVMRLEHARWVLLGTFAGDAVVRAEPFDAIDIEIFRWWGRDAAL